MITLPKLEFFVAKAEGKYVCNVITGSSGTDSARGCLCKSTFNYRIVADYIDGTTFPKTITATCWMLSPFTKEKGCEKGKEYTNTFECSEKGVMETVKWLKETENKLMETDAYEL